MELNKIITLEYKQFVFYCCKLDTNWFANTAICISIKIITGKFLRDTDSSRHYEYRTNSEFLNH